MRAIHHLARAVTAGGIVAAVAMAEPARAADPFVLSSTTFKDGTMMPKRVSNLNTPQNPNCVGENMSPQLSWTGVPAGTKSLAILMEDPEGRGGSGVHHWVAYGIAPTVTGLAEGEASKPTDKFVGGKSARGIGTYSGPCAGPGIPHHYTFILIATDLDPKELPPGLTREEFLSKIVPPAPAPSRAKGTAGLVGLYAQPAD